MIKSKRVRPGTYEVPTDMGTFTVYSYELDPDGGYGSGTMWQVLLDDEWIGNDPVYTKREALENIEAFLRRERL
jgi:hypothetical protein